MATPAVQERVQRPNIVVLQCVSPEVGASDGDFALDMCVPGKGATLIDVTFEQQTAGAGSGGTVAVTLEAGLSTAGVAIAEVASGIDVDIAAGTIHGAVKGLGQVAAAGGTQLQLASVKTGTVSTGPKFLVTTRWQL